MNLKKSYTYIIIGLSILIIGIFIVNAAVNKTKAWHSGGDILVTVDGNEKTLQEMVENDIFSEEAIVSYTETLNFGHGFNNLLVTVDSYTMTLQEAIDNNIFIDGATQNYTTSIPVSGHLANEIEIFINAETMSLQEAIDSGKFCIPNCTCVINTCVGNTCIDTHCNQKCNGTKVADCTGKECGDDGCGGSCGNCPSGEQCYIDGKCCQETGGDCGGYSCGEVIIGWESGVTENQKIEFINIKGLCRESYYSFSLLALPVGRQPPEACTEYSQSSLVNYCEPNYLFYF